MLILGIDPSLAATGIAVIDTAGHVVVHSMCIQTKPNKRMALKSEANFDRAIQIAQELCTIIEDWNPAVVCMELPAGSQSAVAASALSLAKGVVAGVLATHGLAYATVTPTELKKKVAGSNTASKEDVQNGAFSVYALDPMPTTKVAREAIGDAVGACVACRNNPVVLASVEAHHESRSTGGDSC